MSQIAGSTPTPTTAAAADPDPSLSRYLDSVVQRLEEIDTHEQLESLLAELGERVASSGPMDEGLIEHELGSDHLILQARGLLRLTALRRPMEHARICKVLASARWGLAAAAALHVIVLPPEDDALLEQLIVGPSPLTPPVARGDGGFYLARLMGLSGNDRFVPALSAAFCRGYHFASITTIAKALGRLGLDIDPAEHIPSKSICINGAPGEEITISTDSLFAGSSNCPDCRFFPCRINTYYSGAIESCALWNRTDPADLGEIVDQRVDRAHETVDVPVSPIESSIDEDRSLIDQGRSLILQDRPREAIPPLCQALINTLRNGSKSPSAWVLLHRCFIGFGERLLSFIALREASIARRMLPDSLTEEHEELDRFRDDPELVLGRSPQSFCHEELSRRGIEAVKLGYKGLWTLALDRKLELNIISRGDTGGTWFEMGTCHRALGELALAELFMRMAALLERDPPPDEQEEPASTPARRSSITADLELRVKFDWEADLTHRLAEGAYDPGLNLKQRAIDRSLLDPNGAPLD